MVRNTEVDLAAIGVGNGGEARDSGVAHDAELLAFTDAVMRGDDAEVARTRDALEAVLGKAGVVDTAAVMSMFNVVDRVADATGIPIDEPTRDMRYGVGAELGMQDLTPEARGAR